MGFTEGRGEQLGMGQNLTTGGPQVLVLGSIYQGSMVGFPYFRPPSCVVCPFDPRDVTCDYKVDEDFGPGGGKATSAGSGH